MTKQDEEREINNIHYNKTTNVCFLPALNRLTEFVKVGEELCRIWGDGSAGGVILVRIIEDLLVPRPPPPPPSPKVPSPSKSHSINRAVNCWSVSLTPRAFLSSCLNSTGDIAPPLRKPPKLWLRGLKLSAADLSFWMAFLKSWIVNLMAVRSAQGT